MAIEKRPAFGDLLRQHRLAAGLTQEGLAERAGLSARGLSDLERGARLLPHPATVLRLANALRLSDAERAIFQAAPSRPMPAETAGRRTRRRSALPAPLTSFVGREREIVDLAQLMAASRLVTVTGAGGCGKTRLALEVAARVDTRFHGGSCFVPLASIRSSQNEHPTESVASAMAQILQIRGAAHESTVETLKRRLREDRLLVVLDNFEHLMDAATLIVELLTSCPGLAVLATTRQLLHLQGEQVYPVPPLALPDTARVLSIDELARVEAIQLFVERARAVAPGFSLTESNRDAVTEICCRLDGLPLGIELAAARIRHLSAPALLDRLERRLPLLTGGARDLPARQQALRDAIAWSHDLLGPEERVLFRRLAVFVGGWTLDAARAVCAAEGDMEIELLDGVAALIDKSLVVPMASAAAEPRFTMLETIREFGLERLEASGEAVAAGRRHAEHFTTLAEVAEPELRGPHQVAWWDRLEAEHDNLRAALRWSVEHDDVELGPRAGAALWRFWHVRGHLNEGRRWLTALTAVRGASMMAAARSQVLIGLGSIVYRQGDLGSARAHFEECLLVACEARDEQGTADALGGLGFLAQNEGEYEAARALHLRALTIRRRRGDEWGIAESLGNLAWIHRMKGEYEAARALHCESLMIRRRLGDLEGIAESLSGLAWLAQDRNEFSTARAYYDEALVIRREQGDKGGVAGTLGGLAWLAQNQGDHALAHALYEEALAISRDLGDTRRTELLLSDLAWLFQAERDYAQARVLHTEALALAGGLGDRWGIADAFRAFAMLALAGGEPQRASRLFGAAAAARDDTGMQLSPTERATHDRAVADTAAAIGEAAFASAWAEGRAMSLQEAIAYALETVGPI